MLLLPFRKKGMYDIYINGGHVHGCESSKCYEVFENYLEDKKV